MIFALQRLLEDYFHRRNLSDTDQYAVKIANLYFLRRRSDSDEAFMGRLRRIRTTFYKSNRNVDREELVRQILLTLDSKFSSGRFVSSDAFPEAGIRIERRRLLKTRRRSIRQILHAFRRATQARAVDMLWVSRKTLQLRQRPEEIAQGMLTQFLSGVLSNGSGRLFRELASGVGYVDIVVMLGAVPHLVELKVQRGRFRGPAQLENYMMNENRREGWLVIFDARQHSRKSPIPETIRTASGVVRVLVVDINPVVPSRLAD